MKNFIIIGASSGLGAALVNQFISAKDSTNIVGVARTPFEKIENRKEWGTCGKYTHLEVDITLPVCVERLKAVLAKFNNEPVCVIFNAAIVKTEIAADGAINYGTFRDINRVGIDGFGNILEACGDYLYKYGGAFVGISSFSAYVAPFLEPRIAYPASKAYLDMALRCLRSLWKGKVRVVTVHLGHLGNVSLNSSVSYSAAAKKITHALFKKNIPNEINYPLSYCIVYKYIFKFIPDNLYLKLLQLFCRLTGNKK
jgi:NAD(P)-dependent dehydrogenase (short-subunit alcohol dehydrogenase family)